MCTQQADGLDPLADPTEVIQRELLNNYSSNANRADCQKASTTCAVVDSGGLPV